MSDEVALSPPIGALAAAIVYDGKGRFGIPDDAFAGLCSEVFRAPPTARRAHAEEVLALIFRMQGLDKERMAPACTQLATLFSLLVGDVLTAHAQLAGAGVRLDSHQMDIVGARVASLTPVVKAHDGLSALDIRMGRKRGPSAT